jgi:hypothetical protein
LDVLSGGKSPPYCLWFRRCRQRRHCRQDRLPQAVLMRQHQQQQHRAGRVGEVEVDSNCEGAGGAFYLYE